MRPMSGMLRLRWPWLAGLAVLAVLVAVQFRTRRAAVTVRAPERSRVLAVDLPERFPSGGELTATVRIENVGPVPWGPTAESQIKLGARLFPAGGEDAPRPLLEARTHLEKGLAPGQVLTTTLDVSLAGIPPGRYVLKVDMVRELRYWFEQHGSRVMRREIEILPAAPGHPAEALVRDAGPRVPLEDLLDRDDDRRWGP